VLAVRILVEKTVPNRVFVLSMQPDLPNAAMQKYLKVNQVFEQMGYAVSECDPRYRIRCWLMEQPAVG
jgi:hypothetical protein